MKNKIIVEFIPADHWWQQAKWRLSKEYVSANEEVTVPAGFVTDGASIPWIFRPWFSPTGNYFGAAIVHDYILSSEDRNWKKANDQFWKELDALGIKSWRKSLLLMSVKMYYRYLRLVGQA